MSQQIDKRLISADKIEIIRKTLSITPNITLFNRRAKPQPITFYSVDGNTLRLPFLS